MLTVGGRVGVTQGPSGGGQKGASWLPVMVIKVEHVFNLSTTNCHTEFAHPAPSHPVLSHHQSGASCLLLTTRVVASFVRPPSLPFPACPLATITGFFVGANNLLWNCTNFIITKGRQDLLLLLLIVNGGV